MGAGRFLDAGMRGCDRSCGGGGGGGPVCCGLRMARRDSGRRGRGGNGGIVGGGSWGCPPFYRASQRCARSFISTRSRADHHVVLAVGGLPYVRHHLVGDQQSHVNRPSTKTVTSKFETTPNGNNERTRARSDVVCTSSAQQVCLGQLRGQGRDGAPLGSGDDHRRVFTSRFDALVGSTGWAVDGMVCPQAAWRRRLTRGGQEHVLGAKKRVANVRTYQQRPRLDRHGM